MLNVIWIGKNTRHIAENGLTREDVESVLLDPADRSISRSSGRPWVFGYVADGDLIIVVYDVFPEGVYPVTAYPVNE